MKRKLVLLSIALSASMMINVGCGSNGAEEVKETEISVNKVQEVSEEDVVTYSEPDYKEANLIKKSKYTYDGTLMYEEEYDISGNCIRINDVRNNNSFEYEYDEAGKISKEIEHRNEQYTYAREYEEHGFISSEKCYDAYKDGQLINSDAFFYEFDDAGKPISGTAKRDIDGPSDIKTWDVEFDDAGHVRKKTNYGFSLMTSENYIIEEHEYDENGNEIKNVKYDNDGNIKYSNESEFDADGNIIKENINDYGDLGTIEHEYDENKNEIKQNVLNVNGEVISSIEKSYEYEYDQFGNIMKLVELQGENAVYYTEYEYEFIY